MPPVTRRRVEPHELVVARCERSSEVLGIRVLGMSEVIRGTFDRGTNQCRRRVGGSGAD